MLNQKILDKIDTNGMYKAYNKWPEIAENSYNSNLEPAGFVGIDHVVFSGMGGSGTLGDIFAAILSKTNVHVSVVKGYLLPKTVDKNTLVITTSVSGNTVETLSTLESATKIGCKIIAFSSGGKLEIYSKKNNIDYRKIPFFHSPRASFASFLFSALRVLEGILPIERNAINLSIKQLKQQQKIISSINLSNKNPALTLAEWLTEIPVIYFPSGLQAAAIRFKNSLQENAKMHAMTEDVIEACHNGIVAWEKSSNLKPVLIRGSEDYSKTKERWDIMKRYFTENNIDFKEIISVEGNILSKLVNLIYLLDFSTIYRAVLFERDPSPVNSIDYVKRLLQN